jgi:hypothetical protein
MQRWLSVQVLVARVHAWKTVLGTRSFFTNGRDAHTLFSIKAPHRRQWETLSHCAHIGQRLLEERRCCCAVHCIHNVDDTIKQLSGLQPVRWSKQGRQLWALIYVTTNGVAIDPARRQAACLRRPPTTSNPGLPGKDSAQSCSVGVRCSQLMGLLHCYICRCHGVLQLPAHCMWHALSLSCKISIWSNDRAQNVACIISRTNVTTLDVLRGSLRQRTLSKVAGCPRV